MDNRRLILLLIFSFSLVMLWDAWHKYNQPKVAAQIAAVTVSANGSPVPVPSATQTSSTTPVSVPSVSSAPTVAKGEVVGAHLTGLPLNGQLVDCGARLDRATRTAPCYRLYELPGTSPRKPGLVRVGAVRPIPQAASSVRRSASTRVTPSEGP